MALGAAFAWAPPVQAAEYQIAQCENNGQPVELTAGFISAINMGAAVNCPSGGSFDLIAGDNTVSSYNPSWGAAGFQVAVPGSMPNTKITSLYAVLSMAPMNGPDPEYSYGHLATYSADTGAQWGAMRGIAKGSDPGFSRLGWHQTNPAGARTLNTLIQCYGPCHFAAAPTLSVHRAVITMDDPLAPADVVPEKVGLLNGTAQKGTRILRVAATDADSGVFAVSVYTESGKAVATSLNGAGCTYQRPAPCPQARGQIDLSIDTTSLPEGVQRLEAWSQDAAGNVRKTTLAPFTVDNVPDPTPTPTPTPVPTQSPIGGGGSTAGGGTPGGGVSTPGGGASTPGTPVRSGDGTPNGTGGNPQTARLTTTMKSRSRTVTFGSKVKLVGRLADASGTGLAGAQIDVFEQVALQPAPAVKVATVATDAKGNYVYTPTATSSRKLEFAYAEQNASDLYRERLAIALDVKVGVLFTSTRRAVDRGGSVTFSGKVLVAPMPAKGVRLVIEATTGKRWVIGGIVRTKADGTFVWKHTFRTRGEFRFRARVQASPDLPAKRNTSRFRLLSVR